MTMETNSVTPKTAERISIDNHSSFEEWTHSLHKFKSKSEAKMYSFNLSELSFYENLKVTTEVDYYNTICGTRLGSILMKFTFLVMVISFLISDVKFSELTPYQVLLSMGVVLLAALIGKTIGILQSKWNLIQISRSIQRRLNGDYSVEHLLQY
jgi:hypothetical protein